MKRVLLIVAFFLAGSFQNAEAFRLKYQNVVRDGNGLIVKGATISAVKAGTATAVNTYATSTATSSVTVTTDSSGVYTVYFDALENGSEQLYDLSISTSYASFSSKNIKPTPVTGTYTISSSQQVVYPVIIPYGIIYSIASGITVTFSSFDSTAGLNQIFTCSTNTCVKFLRGSVKEVSPEWWGAKSDWSTASYNGIQSAINSLPNGGIVKFQHGRYLFNTTLVFANNIIYAGSGRASTVLQYSGTSDAVQVNNAYNSSTSANYTVKDLTIFSSNPTAGKAGFADAGSTYVKFDNVGFSGNYYGLILDQSELVTISNCDFELPNQVSAVGLWLVNGADHHVGASGYYTNQVTIEKSQFNGYTVGTGIADDGGTDHVIRANNFNALATQIRSVGARNIVISQNEFEGASSYATYFTTTTSILGSSLPSARSVTYSDNFVMDGNTECIKFATGSINRLTMNNNMFSLKLSGAVSQSGISTAVNNVIAFNNVAEQNGTANLIEHSNWNSLGFSSDNYVPFNNQNISSVAGTMTYSAIWSSGATTQPSIGSGTITTDAIQNGNSMTVTGNIVMAADTNFGTGCWLFSLPKVEAASRDWTGTAWFYDSSVPKWYYGIVSISPGDSKMSIRYGDTGCTSDTIPFTWSTNDVLSFTITYNVGSNK